MYPIESGCYRLIHRTSQSIQKGSRLFVARAKALAARAMTCDKAKKEKTWGAH